MLYSKKISFNFIAALVKFLVVFPRIFTISFWRNNRYKALFYSKFTCFVIFISPIHKQVMFIFGIKAFNKFSSFRSVMFVSGR